MLEAIPYSFARGGTLLDRLQLMRLMSALFAGFTALFVFLFLRELLPEAPWAWIIGGLAVALVPLLGFMSGAVNPDSMLYSVAAAMFYALARAFRRGLTMRGALAIGIIGAIGLLTKINFVGLIPGVFLGIVVLSSREIRASGRSAYRLPAASAGLALSPVLVYAVSNVVTGRSALGVASETLGSEHGSLLSKASYIWQLYLPRIPGMAADLPGISTARQLWFNGYIGLYGWLDTQFPGWVYVLALGLAAGIAVLCGRSFLQHRSAVRARASEIAVYAAMSVGLMLLVGSESYVTFPGVAAEFAQARYMLPLLALLGAVVALAARGAGRRWGPVVGVGIVMLFLAHDIFSQLQVVARFYS